MDCADHRIDYGHIRQRIGSAAFHARVLPEVSGAHTWCSRCELLLRLAGIIQFRAQGDNTHSTDSLFRERYALRGKCHLILERGRKRCRTYHCLL